MKRDKMRRGFTLLEMIVTLLIILIFATLGIVTYRQLLDNAYQRVCETNLKALEAAVKIYALEMGVLGKLEDLKPEHLRKAYVQVMEKEGGRVKLAYFIVKLTTPPQVYAQFLTPQNLEKYGAELQIFRCPADKDDLPSYGINHTLIGKKWEEIPLAEITIAEADEYVIDSTGDFSYRHTRNGVTKITQIKLKDKKVIKGIKIKGMKGGEIDEIFTEVKIKEEKCNKRCEDKPEDEKNSCRNACFSEKTLGKKKEK